VQSHRQRASGAHVGPGIYRPLPRAFYEQPVLALARALLGKVLVRRLRRGGREELLLGRIVETEAYAGLLDPASHSFRGLTPRCATMFGPAGRLYVYFTYGNHFCANVVGGSRAEAAAVLLRALEPLDGIESLRRGRAARARPGPTARALEAGVLDSRLASGPGNLAAACRLKRRHDGLDLTQAGELWIAQGAPPRRVLWTPRVGLGSNPAAPWLWRCIDAQSESLSRVAARPSAPRPSPGLAQLRAARRRAAQPSASSSSAFTPGRTRPSSASRKAPPPVETWLKRP
jgi:DNA-3-methyladenine glycosylase